MGKAVRKNYRFGYATEYNLKRLVDMTGKSETQVVEDAIEQYMMSWIRLQEDMADARERFGL